MPSKTLTLKSREEFTGNAKILASLKCTFGKGDRGMFVLGVFHSNVFTGKQLGFYLLRVIFVYTAVYNASRYQLMQQMSREYECGPKFTSL